MVEPARPEAPAARFLPAFSRRTALRRTVGLAASLGALALAGCASMSPPKDVVSTLSANPEFSTLAQLVQNAGLSDTLRGAGPYTVFAPTNAAFAAVPAKTMDALAKDPAQLKAVLAFHVVPARLASADIRQGAVKSVQGGALSLARAGTFVTVEDAMVTQADLASGNGVVHAIDRVLTPPKP